MPLSSDLLMSFISVHVPTNSNPDSNLPVLIWIHGGGYVFESIGSQNPAQSFVHNSNGALISVEMQYRLGPFGYLPGNEVAKDGTLNAGMLDQQFALQWVQEHIAKFGGDPHKVTIYGESAGGGSVLQHIVAHGGNTHPPLFRAAMMDSPFLPFQYAFDDPISEDVFSMVASQSGCSGINATLKCLRSISATTLNQVANNIEQSNFFGVFTFVPVIDGSFIVERPTVTLSKGHRNSDVVFIMTNTHEGDIFTNPSALTSDNTTLAQYITELFPRMNDSSIQQAVKLYSNVSGLNTVPEQAAEVMGDSIFICPSFYVLEAFGSNSWKGQFAISPALHSDELAYLFADAATGFPAYNNSAFIKSFQQPILATAICLDPNAHPPNLTPEWPSWHETGKVMLFNRTESGQPVVTTIGADEGLQIRCAFWKSLADVNAQ